jgi:16S rRNA (cytosine967-C5)-methyltransferase
VPVSPSRAAAFDILLRVERDRAYASELLHSPHAQTLSSQDHGLATELAMGVLRWQSALDRQIAGAAARPLQKLDVEILTALRLAAYQLIFLDRVPARAAVNESVELVKRSRKRSAIPFANAVLRKLSNKIEESRNDRPDKTLKVGPFPSMRNSHILRQSLKPRGAAVPELAESFAHPPWLVERWIHHYGDAATTAICEFDQEVPETSIRFADPSIERQLQRDGIQLAPGKLLTSARRVLSGDITRTAAFREKRVSIQDEASQLVALLVGKGSTILDCCAAPGGKTRIVAERNPDANVIAMDLHPHRARLLRELVPAGNAHVIVGDVLHLPTTLLFERVLVDVPCSGTGTLSRNPEIIWRLTAKDVADLQARQIAILQSAMNCVAPGGKLVYSTCSLEREENSDVVENALSAAASFHLVNCLELLEALQSDGELALKKNDLDSLITGPFLRTIPGLHPCDGFFAAVLEKG